MFAASRTGWLLVALGVVTAGWAGTLALADLAPPLAVQWVQSMGAEPGNDFPPVVAGNRVLVTHDGKMLCFDTLTGEQQWEAQVKDQNISTAPLLWNGNAIAGLDGGLLGAIKPTDKSIVWSTDCGGYIAPIPQVIGDLLVVGSEQTALALEPNSGKTKWACTLSSPARYGPITDGLMVYFRCQDGSLESVELTSGRFRWSIRAPFGPEAFPPVIAGGRVIVTAGDTLYAIARTGAQAWTAKMPAGVGGPIAVEGDTMFVPCVNGEVYALYARSGRTQYGPTYKVDSSVSSRPLLTESLMIVGTADALIYALDRATGTIKWVYRCRAPEQPVDDASVFGVYAPLVTAEGALYAVTGNGDLYCLSATAADAAGPEFAELKPEPGEALGGDSPTVSFAVYDDGSGVKADSVTLTVDGTPLKLSFDAPSGVGTALLSKPEDGIHLARAAAADYRGNTASKEWSFLTDASLTPPKEPDQTRLLRPGGTTSPAQPGGQARPGGGGGGRRGGGGGG
jgi:outer membrane protein assembly factor BamB